MNYHSLAGLFTEQLVEVLHRSNIPSLTSERANRFTDDLTGYYVQVSLQLANDVPILNPPTHVHMSLLLSTLERTGHLLFPVATSVIVVPDNCMYSMRIRCSRIATGF